MPGLLMRSKSLRLLRGRKDVQQEEAQHPLPLPNAPKTELDKSKSSVPVPRAVRTPETPNLPTRPRTANGPGDRTPLFHKKNPVPSLYSQVDIQSLPSFMNSTTVLPSAKGLGEGDDSTGVIGIALGSPTFGSHWNVASPNASEYSVQPTVAGNPAGISRAKTASPAGGPKDAPKSKLSRWKSLFRRQPKPSPQQDKQSFYQVVQAVAVPAVPLERADSPHTNETSVSQKPEKQEDETDIPSSSTHNPDMRKSRRAKDEPEIAPFELLQTPRQRAWTIGGHSTDPRRTRVKRASTAPSLPTQGAAQEAPTLAQIAESAKSPLRNVVQASPTTPEVVIMGSPQIMKAGALQEVPLLDINIPDVQLERYSVMFNKVFEQRSKENATLLARRSGNAEKLLPVDGLSIKASKAENPTDNELQPTATSPILPSPPRATSPLPSSSPRLSLFPTINPSRSPSPRPASRNRSRARTAAAHSPLSQAIPPSSDASTRTSEVPPTPKPAVSTKPTASPYLKPQRPALTPGSLRSLASDMESVTLAADKTSGESGGSWHVQLSEKEPEWEIQPRPLKVAKRERPTKNVAIPQSVNREPTPAQMPGVQEQSERETQQEQEETVIQTLTRLASQRRGNVTKLSALSSHPSSEPLDLPSPLQNLQTLLSPPSLGSGFFDQRPDRVTLGIARSVSVSREHRDKAPVVGIARSVSVSRASRSMPRSASQPPTRVKPSRPRLETATTMDMGSTGSPQRATDRRTLTPTIVEVGNRRSQRVVIVDA